MNYLVTGDWLVIGIYLVGIVVLGTWLGRGQKNTRDYFLGNRDIPWWGVSLSIVATETSALTFIGVPAAAYGGNLGFIQIITGYVVARVILAIVLVPHYFKGEIYSPYQLFSQAFGMPARRLAGVFFLIAGTLAAGVRVYVTCIPIDLIFGDVLERWFGDPILGAVVLFVVLSLIYTCVGGIKAVVWTDAVQFLLLLGGGIFALIYLGVLIDGGWGAAWGRAAAAGKLHWLNTEFSLFMPYNIWMGLIGATVMVLSTHGADQLNVQRVLACRSIGDGRRALVLSAVIILPLFLLFLLVGALLWVYFQQTPPAIPLPESQAGFQQNDYVFPVFIITEAPPVVRGFMIVAILSAAMSSVSSALSALASVSTMDLVRGFLRQARSEAFFLKVSRASTVFWGLMLIWVAWRSREVKLVLEWAFSLNGLTNGAMLGGLVLSLMWRRGRAWPVVIGMLAGLGFMIWISRHTWTVEVEGEVLARTIAWPWYTTIGAAVTLAVAWLVRRIMAGPKGR